MPRRKFERPPQTPLKALAKELGADWHQPGTPMRPQVSRADSAYKNGKDVLKGLGLDSNRPLALGRLVLSLEPDILALLGLEELPSSIHPNPHPRVALIREKNSRFWPEDFAWRAYDYTQHHAPRTSRQELKGTGSLRLYSAASTPDFYTVRLNFDAETTAGQDMIEESQRLYSKFSRKPESLQPKILKPNATLYLLDEACAEEHVHDLRAKIGYMKVTFTLGAVGLGHTYARPEATP